MPKYPLLVWYFFAAIIITLGRIPIMVAPPWDIDEGVFATIGQALGRGELLYQNIWDNKPPGIYFLFDWIGHFTRDYIYFRWIGTVCLVLILGVLFYLAVRILTRRQALMSLAIITFLSIVPILETHVTSTELFLLLPTSGAMLLTYLIEWGKWSRRNYLLVGALLAIAFLFKVVAVFDGAAILSWLVLRYGWGIKSELRYLAIGAVVVLLLPLTYLLTNQLTANFIQAAFLNNFGYVRNGNFITVSSLAISSPWITMGGKIIALGVFLKLIWSRFHKTLSEEALLYFWLTWTVFGALLSGRPYLHYLIPALGAFSLLAPVWWEGVKKVRSISLIKIVRVAGITLAALTLFILGFAGKIQVAASNPELSRVASGYFANSYRYLTGQISQQQYFDFYGPTVTLNLQLADYLKTHTKSSDKVFIWGNAPWVYYLSDRQHATKYLLAYHLDFIKEAKTEILSSLKSQPPQVVIVTNEPDYLAKAGSPTPVFPELFQLLNTNYQLTDHVGTADIYERISLADARTP